VGRWLSSAQQNRCRDGFLRKRRVVLVVGSTATACCSAHVQIVQFGLGVLELLEFGAETGTDINAW
jgi:hypothetical protein